MKIYAELSMNPAERALLSDVATGHDLWMAAPEVLAASDETACSEAEIIFGAVSACQLAKARRLRWLQLPSAGVSAYTTFDWTALEGRVVCTNLRGVFDEPVAQTTLAGILAHYRGLEHLQRLQAAHAWQKLQVRPGLKVLREAHVLMLGGGAIAGRVRELLGAFGCTFTVYARTSGDIRTTEELEVALPQADIVVAALPETPLTVGLLDGDRIGRMKKGALFVNVGRGSLADEQALAEALRSGRLGGAVLDVTCEEPLSPASVLWDVRNLLLTQHTSAGSDQEVADTIRLFGENLARYVAQEPLLNVVDWKRGY